MNDSTLYDTDFFLWTQDTASKLRGGRFAEIDICAAAEEIEDMGKRDRRGVNSALTQLLAHLLKWQYRPEYRQLAGEASWQSSIAKQRQFLADELEQSPSLERYALEDLAKSYKKAVVLAELESGLKNKFPPECPYEFGQILNIDFLPD